MKYKWFLFDIDGTLFDYDRAEGTALRRTLEEFGIEYAPSCSETYRRINSDIWHQFEQGRITQERLRTRRFELLFEALQVECEPEAFSLHYLRNLAEGSELICGAEEVVKSLHSRVALIVITNGLADVQRPRLAKSPIGDYFSDIVISEEVGAAKPHEEIFEVAFDKMGYPRKAEVLMIGDSLSSDIKGGNTYGIDTCWFNPQGERADQGIVATYEIGNLHELLRLVEAS